MHWGGGTDRLPLTDVDCPILDRLGKDLSVGHRTCVCTVVFPVVLRVQDFAYELCVGQNGRVWLSAPTARETVLLLQVSNDFLAMTFSKVKAFRGWVLTVSMAKPSANRAWRCPERVTGV